MTDLIKESFLESVDVIKNSLSLSDDIKKSSEILCKCIRDGNCVYLFGNGGSAADAQHIAAELIGRYKIERSSMPAISLSTDTSILTSISNDYSFDTIFSRQCEGLVNEKDVIIAISTSGNSKNVINGVITAKKKNAIVIGLLGNDGGKLQDIVDIPLIVKSKSTARIQEVHRIIYHILCELVEKEIAENGDK